MLGACFFDGNRLFLFSIQIQMFFANRKALYRQSPAIIFSSFKGMNAQFSVKKVEKSSLKRFFELLHLLLIFLNELSYMFVTAINSARKY
jgi:hypothetical protein